MRELRVYRNLLNAYFLIVAILEEDPKNSHLLHARNYLAQQAMDAYLVWLAGRRPGRRKNRTVLQ